MTTRTKKALPDTGGWVIISHAPPRLSAAASGSNEDASRLLPEIPVGSVHWAVPSTIARYARRQKKIAASYGEELTPEDIYAPSALAGAEPNWLGAMSIQWDGAEVRLFPHEAHPMNRKGLGALLHSEAYELVPGDVAAGKLVQSALDGETRPIYEAALIDGCTENLALAVALGHNVLDTSDVPYPMGWYRLREPYASVFN